MTTERRNHRSEVTDYALSHYFENLLTSAKCTTIALSDDQGLLISGSGQDQEVLAAYATAGQDIGQSETMRIGGFDFVLAWDGGSPEIEKTRAAITRILMLS